ncbi:MAG: sigma-70 family RNA polymerase sigma factor [Woeseia sp.]
MPVDFEELIGQNMGRIRLIARRYAAHDAVDDLVQTILLQLWRSYGSFRGDARVETWVYRVALNTAMTHLGQAARDRDGRVKLHAAVQSQALTTNSTSEAEILNGFLGSLGDIDASVLMMYLDGLSGKQIAAVLGIQANAVHVRISRLKQKFHQMFVE